MITDVTAPSDAARLSHSEVIQSALVTVGYANTIEHDLDFAAGVVQRCVQRYREKETKLSFDGINEKQKLKSTLVLRAMYTLEEKFKNRQLEARKAAAIK